MENSMKEHIKNIEELINEAKKCNLFEGNKYHEAIEHILSDYKRVLKENEELKEDRDKFKKALGRRITYCNELEKDLFENSSNYVIPKQIVKDKIEEYDKQRIKMEKDDIGVGFTLGKEWSDLKAKIEALQDLLEKE